MTLCAVLTVNAIQRSQSPQCSHRTEGGRLALRAHDEVEQSIKQVIVS